MHVLKIGSHGTDVRHLQNLLHRHEPRLPVDGLFGPRTEQAVRLAQQRLELHPPDGIAGPITLGALARTAGAGTARHDGQHAGTAHRPPHSAATGVSTAVPPADSAASTGITVEQLQAIMPNAGAHAAEYVNALNAAMRAQNISSPAQRAAFLAQIAVESGDLNGTSENLNYSAHRLTQVWPRRFPTVAAATPYAHNPEALANNVYADRLGNGDEASGDGWRYRGRGLMQVTGRSNYRQLGYENDPEALANPIGASNTAAAFWTNNNLNARTQTILNRAHFNGISRTINGGDNGSNERWTVYQRAITALQAGQ